MLTARLGYIQLVRGGELGERAQVLRTREISIHPKRGAIRDIHGRELAISVDVDSLYAVPAEVVDPQVAASSLAPIVGLAEEDLVERLSRATSFVWIQRKMSTDMSAAVRELDLQGFHWTRESERYYPKGDLAGQLLGFAGIDNQGLEGVEFTYDDVLRGEGGSIVVEFDADGRQIPRATYSHFPATPGHDIYLTIDEVLQYVAEKALARVVEEQDARGGVVVLMEPATGRVLAMASSPGFDPNRWAEFEPSLWRNPIISSPDHPGSVFKPITAAAAIDAGVVNGDTRFHDPGHIRVPGATIRNWDLGSLGDTDFRTAFAKSANVIFVKVAQNLGMDRFYNYLRDFGFASPTGIALPGEADSIIPEQSGARPVDLAVMSFGQTLAVTPLQLASGMSAIANGGELMLPRIVDGVSRDGIFEPTGPEVLRRVISEQAAAQVRDLMVYTVEEGTAAPASIPGYVVGGKTGTAQKTVDGRVSTEDFISTFVGFAPALEPAVLCFVAVDEPKEDRFGSVVAAPIFKEVVAEALRHLDVPPDRPEEVRPQASEVTSEATDEDEESEAVPVPDVRGLDLKEALDLLGEQSLEGAPTDEGERVAEQFPSPGTLLEPGSTVIIYPEMIAGDDVAPDHVTVPNVSGKGLRSAAEILGEANLRMEVSGSGLIVRQEPRAGTTVPEGTLVRLELEVPED